MVSYLDAAGIRKMASTKKLQARALRAWMAGLVCSALAGAYSLWMLKEREKAVNKKDGESVVEGKKIQKFVLPPPPPPLPPSPPHLFNTINGLPVC